jgi:uncharacterized membrane protein
MKRILRFLRTTLIGGLLFLVPIVLLIIVLGKALTLAVKIVDPLAARIPVQSVIGLHTPMLLATSLIVLLCFMAGFIARSRLAQKVVSRLEDSLLLNLPGYELLKGMSASVLGVENEGIYPIVLVRFDDSWQIGFRSEALDNGLIAVFVPGAPNPQSGAVYFMTADRVKAGNIPLAATLKCLRRLGVGSSALLRGLSVGAASAK